MDATLFSLQYGLPLYAFASLAVDFVYQPTPTVNVFVPFTSLATPAEVQVVKPNVDTLYSAAVIDLAHDDIVVSIPDVDANRFWNFAFYNPFGDNFANIGSVNNNTSGQYLLRRSNDCGEDFGYQKSDGHDGYHGFINSPTTQGSLLVRVLVRDNESDLSYVQSVIQGSTLKLVPRQTTKGYAGAPLSNATLAGFVNNTNTSLAVMELLAQLAPANPPLNTSDIEHVYYELERAGISRGRYKPPPGVNLTLAYAELNDSLAAYVTTGFKHLGNGWVTNDPQGIYYSNYIDRDIVALAGYLEQVENQALYPMSTAGEMALTNNQSIVYTFSSKPPVESGGFWSLTMYNSLGYLVSNPLDKYAVGDRSNITYPDGSRVYGNSCQDAREDAFQVLVQPYNIYPPANWTNNWLPAPADGSGFSVTLRLYAATSDLIKGDWEFPLITQGSAVTA